MASVTMPIVGERLDTTKVVIIKEITDASGKLVSNQKTVVSEIVRAPTNIDDCTVDINVALLVTGWIKNWDDIAVAGGHVLNAILSDAYASETGDVDIFFVGTAINRQRMCDKIRDIYGWLLEHYKTEVCIDMVGSSVRFYVPNARVCTSTENEGRDGGLIGLRVQVIFLTSFATVQALLGSFDFNNCQFAIQDGRVFVTHLSMLYLQTKQIFYYNPQSKNSRRKIRMLKYSYRPYNKIVNVDKCPLGCSASDLLDYYKPSSSSKSFPGFGHTVTIEQALSFIE